MHVQHVILGGMAPEPASERNGEGPSVGILPLKIEVTDTLLGHGPVEWHIQLCSAIGRRRGDVHLSAQRCHSLSHAFDGDERAAIKWGHAGDHMENFHAVTPLRTRRSFDAVRADSQQIFPQAYP